MSPNPRRSIRKTAWVGAGGRHTGAGAEGTFRRAPAGQGVVFRRTDLPGRPEVRARLTEVQAVERRTAIGRGETTIHTIEHLLAAVAAHEIDDLTIELSGPELPILDGSVQPYYEALARADPGDVGGEPVVLAVQAPLDRKSTRLNSSHSQISYAVFCLKKKKRILIKHRTTHTLSTDNTDTHLDT